MESNESAVFARCEFHRWYGFCGAAGVVYDVAAAPVRGRAPARSNGTIEEKVELASGLQAASTRAPLRRKLVR